MTEEARLTSRAPTCATVPLKTALRSCERAAQWQRAVELLRLSFAEETSQDLRCYAIAISACSKAVQWRAAAALLPQLQAHGLQPSTAVCNALATACERSMRWADALALLQRMEADLGAAPDLITFSACISACEKGMQWDGKDQKPVVALTRGSRDFAFMRTLDPVLASTLVAIGFMKVGNFRLPLSRPLTYKTPESGDVPPLDIASFMATNPDAPQPPPPPPVRTMRCTNDLWVGNLHPPDADPTLLEEHLTRVALESPGYDMESGPPIKTLVLHYSRRYAFVRLRNDDLLAKLQPVFDGSLFCGRALAVNLSRRNTAAALTCGVGVRRPAPGLDDVDAEDL
eukprot:TRINITY_DN1182_c0_g1_i10.p1 TRINITY_DN1182_c0_g1~~TRINITY_DN1182_c0_g1_i10.p1  ORF type:complete len:343 (+),score=89.41 TRINITY_DN1182_c0_g1_i10:125-1153(+)